MLIYTSPQCALNQDFNYLLQGFKGKSCYVYVLNHSYDCVCIHAAAQNVFECETAAAE